MIREANLWVDTERKEMDEIGRLIQEDEQRLKRIVVQSVERNSLALPGRKENLRALSIRSYWIIDSQIKA
jgi:hypothetical protein